MAEIDKSWMTIKNREDSRYEDGVAKFWNLPFTKKDYHLGMDKMTN